MSSAVRDKPIPPSRSRIAAAADAGLFPRSALLVSGAALSGAGMALILSGATWTDALQQWMRSALSSPLSLDGLQQEALLFASRVAPAAAGFLLAMIVPAAAALLLPALFFVRGHGSTTVPIPSTVEKGVSYYLCGVLSVLLALLVTLHDLTDAISNGTDTHGSPAGTVMLRASLILISGGLLQLSLYRSAMIKQLSLSSDEQKKEGRLHGADPAIRERIRTAAAGRRRFFRADRA